MSAKLDDDFEFTPENIEKSGIRILDIPHSEETEKKKEKTPKGKRIKEYLLKIFNKIKLYFRRK